MVDVTDCGESEDKEVGSETEKDIVNDRRREELEYLCWH